MARVTVHFVDNPLRFAGAQRVTVDCVGTVAQAVAAAYPDLALDGLVYVRQGREAQPGDAVRDRDHIIAAARPGAVVGGWAAVAKIVATALISAAASYLIAYLLRPKDKKNKAASPAYNVNIEQNAARLGATIPVAYGRVLALPDIAAQPYTEYVNQNERASMILCLGMGDFTVHDILLGDARVSDFPSGTVTAYVIPPALHKQTIGNVEALSGVCEDMLTVPESSGVDLSAPNDPSEVAVGAGSSGGTLLPNDPTGTLWNGLIPGNKYIVANSAGGSVVATYIGVGANNAAVFDTPLPTVTPTTVFAYGRLQFGYDAKQGDVAALIVDRALGLKIDELVDVDQGGIKRGPYRVYNVDGVTNYLAVRGPGFESTNNTPIPNTQGLNVIRNAHVVWTVTPYVEGSTPSAADPYRWRGWYAMPRPGDKVSAVYFDIVLPSGVAWITDKGDYLSLGVTLAIDIQEIDDTSSPIGAATRYTRTIQGATSTPQRITFDFPLSKPARYRVRIARQNNRDQRASKEISLTQLGAIRGRIYHAPNTSAYENATLIAMRFVANAGLAAAASRRIRVDCTRKLPDLTGAGLTATSNPAYALRDLYTNTNYGAGRPAAELDTTTLARLAPQWGTTAGFNGIFDQPITVIEAAQAVLAPVAAMPLPIGSTLSVAQDCPRPYAFVFGPDTIVTDTLSLGYNFDGLDEPDCLEVVYNDPATFAEMRVFYPVQGIKPESVELFGCTSAAQALDWGKLRWQEKQANRKTCQFDLEGEGYLLEPLTHFGLVVPSITRGEAGMVTGYRWPDVYLDAPFPTGAAVIHFKQWDGTIGPPVNVFRIVDPFHIVLANNQTPPPDGSVHPSDQYGDGTRWVAGFPTEMFFEFSVSNLEANGPMRVRVTGTQYTAAKFAGTFVEGWTP